MFFKKICLALVCAFVLTTFPGLTAPDPRPEPAGGVLGSAEPATLDVNSAGLAPEMAAAGKTRQLV